MFTGKRRFEDTRQWVKVEGKSLDDQFKDLPEDYDIYIIKHYFYCMATAPMIIPFFVKEDVEKYLKNSVSAGDRIEAWAFILDSDSVIDSKMPDEDGLVPFGGAY